jgi:O-antigen/teichoic acid export membrane protein
MDKRTSLGKNILIFGLGTSLSKVMSLLLVILYTAFLTPADYGYYDILIIIIAMTTPLVTVQITDALYRNLLDTRDDDETGRSVTCAFSVIASGLLSAVLILCIINMAVDIRLGWILPGYFVTTVLLVFSQQTARGLKRNTVFAVSGVIYSFTLAAVCTLFIVVFDMNIEALLFSTIIADVVAILYIEITIGVYRRVKLSSFDIDLVKSMCRYSIPLLPNAVVLMLFPLLCRMVIISIIDTSASGIFATSAKFPTLLQAILSIFALAWQESAITEYDSAHRDEYYSKMFNLYMRFLLCALLLLLSITRGVAVLIIGEEFSEAWRYIPFLYIGSVFAAFSQFYGTGYLSSKKTAGMLSTTLIGMVCGSVCLFLVPAFGIQAAALAQMTAFVIMFLSRVVHTRQFFRIRIELPAFIFLTIFAGGYVYCYYLADIRAEIAMLAGAIIVFLLFNRELIRQIILDLRRRYFRRTG